MPNYNEYNLSRNEKIKYFITAYISIFAVSYLFYANILISVLFGCLAYYNLGIKRKQIIKKRKKQLLKEFRNAIYLLSTSFSAGYSVENAFRKTVEALKDLYQGQETLIISEFEYITNQLGLNKTIDTLLLSLSKRANMEDITNFVDVFLTCESTGGNLNEVIRNTTETINEKITIESEIEILITNKKLEQKIISIIPICIMLMLSISAGNYVEPLHNSVGGYIVTTIVIGIIYAASVVAKKIINIEV